MHTSTKLAAACLFAAAGAIFTSLPLRADEATIEVVLQNDAFSPAEIKVPAGQPFTLKVSNKESAAAEIEAKGLKIEKVAAAGTDVVAHVKPLKPGRYLIVNEYKEDHVKAYVVAE
ncbi:cupredoxin domain-containing protein [Methylovirgula sp. 4M-Z18]|uniref:cupredoxin domain-containing protein n=1 Tax=Methylovirgula sp. 4M-Z18 TaxID=2293567 RepID=UPI001314974A|nr:cupredoxin domain-containing protein [Methylovirgula sp. 4M-Z18]